MRQSAAVRPALELLLLACLSFQTPDDPPGEEERAPEGPSIRRNLFRGTDWIPAAALEAHLGLLPGDRFTPDAAAEALRRLLSWEFVESASPPEVEAAGAGLVDLTWTVAARPLVREVRVLSRPGGSRPAVPSGEALEDLRTRAGRPLVKSDLEEDRRRILEKRLQEGFPLAEATVRTLPVAPGSVEVELEVDDGPRIAIDEIEVRGNQALPRRHILSVMTTRPRLLFGLLSPGRYSLRRLEEDLDRVRGLYLSRGHLGSRVSMEPLRFSADLSRVRIVILVEEGPRYRLSQVKIAGNGPGVPTEVLRRQVRSRPGAYDGRALEEDRRRLIQWYQERYGRVPRIEVEHEFSLDPRSLDVAAVLQIDEGRHIIAGKVDVEGNVRTRDRVVRSALTVLPGLPLTEIALEDSARRVAALGYFEKSALEAPPAGRTRDVRVEVEERRTGLLEVGGGASTGEGEIGYLRIAQPNFDLLAFPGPGRRWRDAFSGGGQLLQVEYAPGTRQSELFVRFEEPYLVNSRHSLSAQFATLFYDRRGYEEGRLRGELGVKRLWGEWRRFSTGLGYVLEDVEVSGFSAGAPPDVTEARGHTFLAYPRLRIGYTDLEVDPYSGPLGFVAEARGDAAHDATGSERSFLRGLLSTDHFWSATPWLNAALPGEPLSDAPARRHLLRLSGRFGWVEGIDGDRAPISERFFLGGPRSVRGFDYRGLGPEAAGVRVGGEVFYQGTVEYSFPVAVPELRAVLLFDFGDLEREVSRLSARRIRTAAGAGLRLRARLPLIQQVIPMDFYWVETLAKERDDEERFFTFTIGFSF